MIDPAVICGRLRDYATRLLASQRCLSASTCSIVDARTRLAQSCSHVPTPCPAVPPACLPASSVRLQVLMIQGFLAMRKQADRILLLTRMMHKSGFPCYKAGERAVKALEKRMQVGGRVGVLGAVPLAAPLGPTVCIFLQMKLAMGMLFGHGRT